MGKLEQGAKALSQTAEFGLVVGGVFALPVLASLWTTFSDIPPAVAVRFTNEDLRALIVWEAGVLLALGWFLRVRGWSVAHFSAYPTWLEFAQAVALTIASYFAWFVTWQLLAPDEALELGGGSGVDWGLILATSILNPLFEELVLCAYMIPTLARRWGLAAALAVSLAVRVSVHTYQGLPGVVWIALIGLIFSLFYARSQRLWPVLIAHGVLDFIGLANA